MHFIINKELLSQQLNILQKGLPIRTPLPVLNGIKIDVYEKEIVLTASNSDLTIQSVISGKDVDIKQTGSVAILGKFLTEIVKKINSSFVEIKTEKNQNVIIKAERSEFRLRLMDVSDYPAIEFINQEERVSVDTMQIQEIVKQTSFSASEDEKRPILTGIHFYNKNKKLYSVSTNGFRLSQKITQMKSEKEEFKAIVPKKSLEELQKILEITRVEKVNVSLSERKVLFSFANIILQTRLFDGVYPETENVIPNKFETEIPFNKNDLLAAVERVSLLSPKEREKYNIIKFKLNKDKTITLSSVNSEIGEAYDVIIPNGEIKGEAIEIAFSSKYLIEALRSFISQDVKLCFINSKKPFIVSGLKDKNLLQIILPVSFKN